MTAPRVVDCRNKLCPIPILELARALKGANRGDEVLLLATDPAAPGDVRAFCASTGHELRALDEEPGPVYKAAVIRR